MKKIISLFERSCTGRKLLDQPMPSANWVVAGEGVATRKFDGTCCRVLNGVLWKRFDAKHGRTPPVDFEPAQDPDPITGHWPGWVKVNDSPDDKWHREAADAAAGKLTDGTYELCGPKIQGNPERLTAHTLVPHGKEILDAPRTFEALKTWLAVRDIEGIVWHHPDGRMVKIKKKDFGLERIPR